MWTTVTSTSLVDNLTTEFSIASADPWTSALIIIGNDVALPWFICSNISSTFDLTTLFFCFWNILDRYSAIFLATASLSTTTKSSPARGLESKPKTSTGIEGFASLILFPLSSTNALTLPHSDPDTKISLTLRVPFCTRTVATEPLPFSNLDSIMEPLAVLLGFALKFNKSACNKIDSLSLSKLIFFNADTSTSKTSPLSFSTIISWVNKSCLTFSGSIFGKSILLIATIMGTLAAFAWAIDSIVWGLRLSSAATTKIIISVVFAPLALIFENAAWPGVSIKVIFLSFSPIW